MTSGLARLVAAIGGRGIAGARIGVRARGHRRYAPGSHALIRDPTGNPLAKALRHGYGSVQIPLCLDDTDRLLVGANQSATDPGNTIDQRILGPLADRVARVGGQVHAHQRGPFTLMLDILESEPGRQARAYEALDRALRAHPELLTRCADGIVVIGPVMVVLTSLGAPRHLLAAQPDRYAFCDGSFGDVDASGTPASLVPVVSEHWAWRFGWDGRDEMPIEERHLLRGLVGAAQAEGRRVRIFGIPERSARVREAYWRECLAAGVDLISAQGLAPLARYLRGPAAKVPASGRPVRAHTTRTR
jgi:hypothetical protein